MRVLSAHWAVRALCGPLAEYLHAIPPEARRAFRHYLIVRRHQKLPEAFELLAHRRLLRRLRVTSCGTHSAQLSVALSAECTVGGGHCVGPG